MPAAATNANGVMTFKSSKDQAYMSPRHSPLKQDRVSSKMKENVGVVSEPRQARHQPDQRSEEKSRGGKYNLSESKGRKKGIFNKKRDTSRASDMGSERASTGAGRILEGLKNKSQAPKKQ